MLLQSQKESSSPNLFNNTKNGNFRAVFKKSHTCGSLFAKCSCSEGLDDRTNHKAFHHSKSIDQERSTKLSLDETNFSNASNKRSSNPDLVRYSKSPEVCLCPKLPKGTNVVKTNVYLNHPEINFPIPVEIPADNCDKCKVNQRGVTPVFHPEIKNKLDYHKYTALAYESQSIQKNDEAQKFLQDFGILSPMGNIVPSSIRKSSIDGEVIQNIKRNSKNLELKRKSLIDPDDYEYLKSLVSKLKYEISDIEGKYEAVQSELLEVKKQLGNKEAQVVRLQREIHKLKSVLQQTNASRDGELLANIQKQHAMANGQLTLNNSNHSKKQGVSAESSEATGEAVNISITKYDKDFRSKQLIKGAIMDNSFLKNLDTSQVREMVDAMYVKEFCAGSLVVKEGTTGVHLFVSGEGDFEIIKDGKVLGLMGPGKAFGELAILYNCTRTASIRAVTDVKVWILDRKVFQQIMMRTGLQRLQDNLNFLKSVPLLQNICNDVLAKIADALEVEFYPAGAHIIRQGASGDTFFIICSGSVKVTQRLPGQIEEEEIRVLQRGDYFGEQALLKEDVRTASVIAIHPGVECLTLDRESFKQLIGDISEIREKDYGDEERLNKTSSSLEQQEYEYIQLDDLEVIATLGIGGFGRVELVQYIANPSLTFALKCLKKQHIVDTQQQKHVQSERSIMMSCRSPFICRLYRSYRDSKYVYMLLEACLGGEVWTILRDRGCFDDHTTRFITACVIEAFDYLHARGIIYRDLKPENLLLDSNGYVKIVDFGFSKRLGYSNKTWTFCGTPEYVAPEVILNKGHDKAVDFWALGILMHELLTGNPPFRASDPMNTYNLILKGIDMIDFARYNVGRTAQGLIKKLCKDVPSERLGCQRAGILDIKKHKWFQGFDWDGLVAQTLPAPIQQAVRSPCDTSNFDSFPKDDDIPPDELSNWDINF
ncbi:cGMP-dependent protein kinase, isozyme 1-like [Diorhabda carinulata]|uniref:cGMP-dependent protein kinase, isozyme 1-like n=1 Tax=Diorhabda carinulata TaxID=1163345 RepID=UPI0025A1E128|nr:cGMP-dependent protein kinase, isozyme 1-like [Diorhabda carinulata]XP_057667117.1 cGMP-dependent protein kinase, isozyme 1-like [Diorhabda carinulata]XP_057667118.1 cGMP-dependent protein kinase, isozyme 1-like [Diorhabda carinulata]XP_057667119.1 cGMP-dependent protein kinase, isozyme 1-like [Diorhabda carinulata]